MMSEHLNMVTHLVERLHEGDRGSNPGRDRPKSLTGDSSTVKCGHECYG